MTITNVDDEQYATYHNVSETSPLLSPSGPLKPRRPEYLSWLSEMWFLSQASGPIILAYMLQNSLQTTSVLIAGRLSSDALAVAAFSYMFAMATAWLIALGGTSAIDTLASTSFALPSTPQSKAHVGILLQRGLFVLTLFYALVAILWLFLSEPLFRLLGQPEAICTGSAQFLALLVPGGLGYVWFECMKKFLQAQGLYRAGTYALLITAPLNILLNHLLVHTFGFGIAGAPIATGISYWLSFLLLVAYYAFFIHPSKNNSNSSGVHPCWTGLSRKALAPSALPPFAHLAFMGIIHVGTEWWAFEIVALAAGRLGTLPLAAQSVVMTADQIINTIPFGLGVAESTRLANLLGAGKPLAARRSAHSAAMLSVLVGTGISVLLMAGRNRIGGWVSEDLEVVRLVAEVIPYVALFQIADGLNGSCGGALRGMGRQWVGAVVNSVSYYGGALPAGIWLAFAGGMGLRGLWLGQCVALGLVGVLEWVIVGMSDWEEEVVRAVGRLER